MKLPRLEWYTVDQLAFHWKVNTDWVIYYIDKGQLTLSLRFAHENQESAWVDLDCGSYFQNSQINCLNNIEGRWKLDGQYIKLEEVKRFEEKHGLNDDSLRTGRFCSKDPLEKALVNWDTIALYLSYNEDYVRVTLSKEENFPVKRFNKFVYAYPSRLNEWRDWYSEEKLNRKK